MAIKAPLHVKPSMYRPGQTLDFHNIQTTCMVKSGFKALIKVCPRSFFWGGKKIPKNKSNPRFRITTEQYFSILTGTHVGSLGTSGQVLGFLPGISVIQLGFLGVPSSNPQTTQGLQTWNPRPEILPSNRLDWSLYLGNYEWITELSQIFGVELSC